MRLRQAALAVLVVVLGAAGCGETNEREPAGASAERTTAGASVGLDSDGVPIASGDTGAAAELPTSTPVPAPTVAGSAALTPGAGDDTDTSKPDDGLMPVELRIASARIPAAWAVEYLDRPSGSALRSRFVDPASLDYLVVEGTPGGEVTVVDVERIAATTVEPSPVTVSVIGAREVVWFTFVNVDGVPSIDVFTEVGDTAFGVVAGSMEEPARAHELAFSVASSLQAQDGVPGDLGLSRAMSWPVCADTFIVVLSSAWGDEAATTMDRTLRSDPDSRYLRADVTCPSLNAERDGAAIYAAYLGPFTTLETACRVKWEASESAYVRRLDLEAPPSELITCPRS